MSWIITGRQKIDPATALYVETVKAAGGTVPATTIAWADSVLGMFDAYYSRSAIEVMADFGGNAGAGSIAYSVIGPNWTLQNNPVWVSSGIMFNNETAGMRFSSPTPRACPIMTGISYDLLATGYATPRRLIGDSQYSNSLNRFRILWDTSQQRWLNVGDGGIQSTSTYNALFPVSTGNNVISAAIGISGQSQSGNSFPMATNSARMISKRYVSFQVQSPSLVDYNSAMVMAGSLKKNVIAIGDSLTHGRSLNVKIRNGYVAQLESLLDLSYGDIPNFGIQGRTAQSMASNATEWSKCKVPRSNSVALVWAGTNDLGNSGQSAAQVQSYIDAILSSLMEYGFKPVVLTLLPSSTYAPFNTLANYNDQVGALNAALSGADYSSGAKAFATVAIHAIPELSDTTNQTYNADGIHLTEAGYGLVASAVHSAIQSLI